MTLHDLARAAGLSVDWEDAQGRHQRVADDVLRAILKALGFPADSEHEIRDSLARRTEEEREAPVFLSVDVGAPLQLPPALAGQREVRLIAEDGEERSLRVEVGTMEPVREPGYYRLVDGEREIELAVAPPSCLSIDDVSARRMWGPAVQIPSLRDDLPRGFGNLGHLALAAERFARAGADAIAISPVHALYPGDGARYSPYSPSSRQFLNAALADPGLLGLAPLPPGPEPQLIDWMEATRVQHQALAKTFAELGPDARDTIERWAAACGDALHRHAVFDALYMHFASTGAASWHAWPKEFHDPQGEAVKRFAAQNPDAVAFQLFVQWLAKQGLERVQSRARDAGMALGAIADLAVGVDPGGSDSWCMGPVLLKGLTIGAPPDPLGPQGQNWGLTTFSPSGLRRSAFGPWLAMLRAALGACGGLRIDHAFGLRRLWVIPQGASALEGAYLTYPFEDMLRLLALESHRARAVIVAEDLGTMPPGFREAISRKAMLGMRVLWFERDDAGRFLAPEDYEAMAVAMTGTHDTPTVAGWWHGRDIDWSLTLGRVSSAEEGAAEQANREHERSRLWEAIADGRARPAPEETSEVVDGAVSHIAKSKSRLAIFPLEDILGLEEQPNLPGTIDEHPNWRRRLPGPLDGMLAEPTVARRIARINEDRPG